MFASPQLLAKVDRLFMLVEINIRFNWQAE